ncbi:MAG: lipid-A-disaccharide synthase [Alphaproteobacteria bacterium]|jgi:lipid-A-disaccharide synthase|nr:lipid-A-disaccharide synthase [Alphaproteobacteria bacterium]MDP6563869.1 lipid-A-disaccharide synthase [Alphaproteobacteria bacterium]MDP6814249.1 lipid-A-disaccharide synthase [Alphaproteobacteria bacterium]
MHFVLVAGEASGDVLGARLMDALRHCRGEGVEFSGIGGRMMAARGLASLFPIGDLSVMGLAEVLPRLPLLLRRLGEAAAHVRRVRPDAVVTIDSPGFSFRLAKRLRGDGVPLIHYVAPQLWAWRPGRARHIAQRIDHMLALLPFEPAFFAEYGLDCEFVGHPVVEGVAEAPGDGAAFRHRHGIATDAPVVALLPGSRQSETSRLLPVFTAAVTLLRQRRPELRVVMPTVEQVAPTVAAAARGLHPAAVVVEDLDERADAFAAANAAVAASGTVSLELALRRVPAVVAYRANALTAALVRRLLKVPNVALPNILAGRRVMPELLQEHCRPEPIAAALQGLLDDEAGRREQIGALTEIAEMLGAGGEAPSLRAAKAVLKVLDDRHAAATKG